MVAPEWRGGDQFAALRRPALPLNAAGNTATGKRKDFYVSHSKR